MKDKPIRTIRFRTAEYASFDLLGYIKERWKKALNNMTDKQKEALDIIIREYSSLNINKDEFYTLMDFIIEEKQTYVPWTTPQPWTQPYYTSTGGTTEAETIQGVDVKEVMKANNICGSEATTVDELVAELKCDNLQLKADLEKAKKQIEKLKMEVSPF